MKNNTFGAATSGTATITAPAAAGLRCAINGEAFWIRLVADRQSPGKLIGKDWDGKTALFDRETKVPASWQAGQFALVREVLAKPTFRVVSLAQYACEDKTIFGAIEMLFYGSVDVAFESPSDNAVLDLLDQRTQEILSGDEISRLLEKEAKQQAERLAQLDREEDQRAAKEAIRQSLYSHLTIEGREWAEQWERLDWSAHFADQTSVLTRHEARVKAMEGAGCGLLAEDQKVLAEFDWAKLGYMHCGPCRPQFKTKTKFISGQELMAQMDRDLKAKNDAWLSQALRFGDMPGD